MSVRSCVGPADIEWLENEAILHRTPCGTGNLTWRQWGKGPPLILLHGGFGSWKHWVRNVGELSKSFTVYAADLPGLGDSDPGPEPITARTLAAIFSEGIDRLVGKDERMYVGAFSLGAAISAPLICMLGDRVRHAILIGPGGLGSLWHNSIEKLRRRSSTMTEEEQREVIHYNLAFSMIANRELIDEDTISLQFELLAQKRRLIGLPISKSSIVFDCLPEIGNRTTFVWGEHDPYPTPDLKAVIKKFHGDVPGVDIRIIDGVGHWANFEADEIVSDMFRDML